MPYNPHAYSPASAGVRNFGFLARTTNEITSAENTPVRTVTVPQQPGISHDVLRDVAPNADDTNRAIAQTTEGPVIYSKTSNLISCPNAEGEVSLGCWLMSSDNDRFARKNLEVDAMPGEAEPAEIMVVPGNWMDLAGTTASPGTYSTVSSDLYNTETLNSEQRIFTGVMMNSNTGQLYETYEDDVPPPNTDKPRLLPEQMTIQNPKVTALSGGWDPSMPARHKVEVPEVLYGDDAGRNIWGPQLYATAIRDLAEQRDVRQQFNNRNGFVPVEPAWDKRAVGFVGYVSAYRGTPHMPPTQREARNGADTFNRTVTNIDSVIDVPAPVNMDLDMENTQSYTNREAYRLMTNENPGLTNQVPGRLEYRPAEYGNGVSSARNDGTTQLYDDGHIDLKRERPVIDYARAPDSTVVHRVPRNPTVPRTVRNLDVTPREPRSVGTNFEGIDYYKSKNDYNHGVRRQDQDASRQYHHQPETFDGVQKRPGALGRTPQRGDQDAGRQYHHQPETFDGVQNRPGAMGRTPQRGDQDAARQYHHQPETFDGIQTRPGALGRTPQRGDQDAARQYHHQPETFDGVQKRPGALSRTPQRGDQDAARQYHHQPETFDGVQKRPGAMARRVAVDDKKEENARYTGDTALNGVLDGRLVDERQFLASFKLVEDRGIANAAAIGTRNMDVLNANAQAGGSTASRLASEGASRERVQGVSTTSGGGADVAQGSRVADWTAHVRDTSYKNRYNGSVTMGNDINAGIVLRAAGDGKASNIRGRVENYRTHGPNGMAASTLAEGRMDIPERVPYALTDEDLYSIVGTRNPQRGMDFFTPERVEFTRDAIKI